MSNKLHLSSWKLTLPVDSKGSHDGVAVEIKTPLDDYTNVNYFTHDLDGGLTFTAMVDGATTKGTKYARSELREMNGTERAGWHLAEGGTMTATLKIDKAPVRFDGTIGKMVIGQIHGAHDEPDPPVLGQPQDLFCQ